MIWKSILPLVAPMKKVRILPNHLPVQAFWKVEIFCWLPHIDTADKINKNIWYKQFEQVILLQDLIDSSTWNDFHAIVFEEGHKGDITILITHYLNNLVTRNLPACDNAIDFEHESIFKDFIPLPSLENFLIDCLYLPLVKEIHRSRLGYVDLIQAQESSNHIRCGASNIHGITRSDLHELDELEVVNKEHIPHIPEHKFKRLILCVNGDADTKPL